jgi:uncharacterized protein YegL
MASDTLGVEETYAVFPFYLCLDVSASMAGEPIESVNRQMPQLRTAIGEDPAIAEVIRLAVVTFSDVARTVLPLSDLSLVEAIPELVSEGRTNYGAAFEHLRRTIEGDYHTSRAHGERWYRPAVVFISDGQPTDAADSWRAAHQRLVAEEWRRRPNLLSFGFGTADAEVLAEVAQRKPNRAFIASAGAEPSAVIPELVAGLISSIVSSSASVYNGAAQLVPPDVPSMTAIPVDQLD